MYIPQFSSLPTLPTDDTESSMSREVQCMQSKNDSDVEANAVNSQRCNQSEPNDLIRGLNLSKESSQVLASRIK